MSQWDLELELRGVKLPERETFFEDLTAHQIVEKINQFHERLKREVHLQVTPFAESYFLNLIALYPVSMCGKTMSDSLKLVVALFFFGTQPTKDGAKYSEQELKDLFPLNKPSPIHNGYTLEDLALIFDRPKAAIAEAIRQKREEAQIILEEATIRTQRRPELSQTPLETLTDEEKHVLVQGKAKVDEKRRNSLPC